MDVDTRLARYAADHLGVLSREECAALGADEGHADRRVHCGLLVPVHAGVYRHAAAPVTFEGLLRAAVLAAGPRAAASGASAMRLYGVRGRWSDEPEVTVVGQALPLLDGVRVRRIDRLDPSDVHRRFGIPVLAPPPALLLLGADEPAPRVENAMHDMVFQRLTTREKLMEGLVEYGGRGRRGTRAYREGIASLPGLGATQTRFELDLLRLVRLHRLPEPVLQLPVIDANGASRRLDLAWPDAMLDVEADGDRWHLCPADRAADRRRDEALRALGWTVLRFGTVDVHHRPDRTLAAIRRSLSTHLRVA